jgi:hypothetical protein
VIKFVICSRCLVDRHSCSRCPFRPQYEHTFIRIVLGRTLFFFQNGYPLRKLSCRTAANWVEGVGATPLALCVPLHMISSCWMRAISVSMVRLVTNACVMINDRHEAGNVARRSIAWRFGFNWSPKRRVFSKSIRQSSRNFEISWFSTRETTRNHLSEATWMMRSLWW